MFEYLRGTIETVAENFVIIGLNGMGFKIFVPANSAPAQKDIGAIGTFFIHTKKTEYEDTFYGFLTENDRLMFRLLMTCDGVGPRAAMSVMCLGTPENIMQAIRMGNVPFLVRASGVSDKTASKIILKLQNKPCQKKMV